MRLPFPIPWPRRRVLAFTTLRFLKRNNPG